MKLLRRTANNLLETAFEIGGELARLTVAVVGRVIRIGAQPAPSRPVAVPAPAPSPDAASAAPRKTAPRQAARRTRSPAVEPPTDPAVQIDEALDADGVLRLARVDPDARDAVVDLEAELDEVRGSPRAD
jgi:hypothetical protein